MWWEIRTGKQTKHIEKNIFALSIRKLIKKQTFLQLIKKIPIIKRKKTNFWFVISKIYVPVFFFRFFYCVLCLLWRVCTSWWSFLNLNETVCVPKPKLPKKNKPKTITKLPKLPKKQKPINIAHLNNHKSFHIKVSFGTRLLSGKF